MYTVDPHLVLYIQYIYCIICYINRRTHTSHMPHANIHSSLSKSHNVCAMTDPIISAPLAFPTGMVSLSVWADFLFLCFILLHSSPFFSFSFFLILTFLIGLKSWPMSNKTVHVESTKVSGRHMSKMQARQPTEPAGCPLEQSLVSPV